MREAFRLAVLRQFMSTEHRDFVARLPEGESLETADRILLEEKEPNGEGCSFFADTRNFRVGCESCGPSGQMLMDFVEIREAPPASEEEHRELIGRLLELRRVIGEPIVGVPEDVLSTPTIRFNAFVSIRGEGEHLHELDTETLLITCLGNGKGEGPLEVMLLLNDSIPSTAELIREVVNFIRGPIFGGRVELEEGVDPATVPSFRVYNSGGEPAVLDTTTLTITKDGSSPPILLYQMYKVSRIPQAEEYLLRQLEAMPNVTIINL